MIKSTPQLAPIISTLQRLQREHAALELKLASAENHLAELELQVAADLPSTGDLRLDGELAQLLSEVKSDPFNDLTLMVDPIKAQFQQVEAAVNTLRSRRDDLESRIGIFQTWVFEEIAEPIQRAVNPRLAGIMMGDTEANEVFRMLQTKVEGLDEKQNFRCFGLVSALDNEGKTLLALGLAMSFASDGSRRVLLLEADLRNPRMESYLGLSHRVGLSEWLQGAPGPVPMRVLEPFNVCMVSAGTATGQATELVASGRMAQLLEMARQQFDFVIVDCPPPFPTADSVILQEHLDGFLFVVRARHAPREVIEAALGHLDPQRIHGVIFNDHSEIIPRYVVSGSQGYRVRP